MEDTEIIELYWQRSESAIAQTDAKYGPYCYKVAVNLLSVPEDAEECVSDTYYQAWIQIPPTRPSSLKAWLGRVVRNISINLWHKHHAAKRDSAMEVLLSELDDCIPAISGTEQRTEAAELGNLITGWLKSLPEADRILFVQRYWYGTSLKELSTKWHMSPGKLAQKMYRLRISLKKMLEKEEISL